MGNILRTLLVCISMASAVSAMAVRYKGDWNVSRGAGGTVTLDLVSGRISGSLRDTGWENMTGERRSGTVSGTYTGGRLKLRIKYSTGADSSFEGNITRTDTTLFLTGLRYINGRVDRDTRFTCNADIFGSGGSDDVTGVWEGTFLYGGVRGHSIIRVEPDRSFTGTMHGRDGTEWRIKGNVDVRRKKIRINVDSGASTQDYIGDYVVLSNGEVKITFPKRPGEFTSTVTRRN